MSDQPPIFIIHLRQAKERRKNVMKAYAADALDFEFIYGVDGHDNRALRRFEDYLPEAFWGTPEIKPGAFGCFLSHRKAWRKIVQDDLPYALIAEDDAVPVAGFRELWPKIERKIEGSDIIWVNERAGGWATKPVQRVNDLMRSNTEAMATSSIKAPGGDGYILTQEGAKKLLRLTKKTGAICGVDWFLFGLCWNRNSIAPPSGMVEFEQLIDILKDNAIKLDGKVSNEALVQQTSMPSMIIHKKSVSIADLRARLLR